MGRLTLDNETCKYQSELILMVLGHLERENNAHILDSWVKEHVTEFIIEGEDIPPGTKQFQVLIHELVKGVLIIKIV